MRLEGKLEGDVEVRMREHTINNREKLWVNRFRVKTNQ